MELKEITELFIAKPYFKRMGNVNISRRLHCSTADVIKAKIIAYKQRVINSPTIAKLPKILFLDIETSPMQGYVFDLWNQNITLDKLISDWFCLCWSAKWLYSTEIISDRLTSEEVASEDDIRIMNNLAKLLDEADIVVTYNGDKFDLKRINTRLLLNNARPPVPYISLDLYKVVKSQFAFASNKLDWLATKFDLPNKLSTSFKLWRDCMEGDEESLRYMERYNRYDVEVLESVYLKLRPWIRNHPNMGLFLESDTPVCPNCGSSQIEENGHYFTTTSKYQLYRCECGAQSRVRVSDTPKEIRHNILNNNIR